MDQFLKWKRPTSFDEVEGHGIVAGAEENGNKVYVGRVIDRDGNYVPAKIIPSLKSGFYAYNNAEESSDEVEFLDNADDYHWVRADGKKIPDAAIVNGYQIGRALYNGNIVVGRVDPDTKELVGSYDGITFNLPSYDVLIYKAKGVVYEAIQKASNVSTTRQSSVTTSKTSSKIVTGIYEDSRFEQNNYFNLVNKVRSLEMEKLSYQKDKQSYEQRIEFEQRKVSELSNQLKKLKIENARFSRDRESFDEKSTEEQRRFTELEIQNQELSINNGYLLKKCNSLEEAIRYEKLLLESINGRFSNSQASNKTLLTKIGDYEETMKIQQEKIFELESEIMISTSNSEALLKRVADYEETVKYLRLQIETILKKLEVSNADNEFLVQKLAMLTNSLRAYQIQIEGLTIKLQSSKTVIANAHAELSRANAQVSKYQAALSSCYVLNGKLMTKVSGMNSIAQHQSEVDYSLNLINYSKDMNFLKATTYGKTSTLLEMTGSDTFLVSDNAQPYTVTTPSADGQPYSQQYEEITPYGGTQAFQPFAAEVAVNGTGETEI
ncbi:CLUMA_CG004568, isoform A [Clunio marinus]|uniref:CLUMA_CG004568, isoform A n=1 Tax=Clunio marinus TaxID=568069 RepID=A0A1J1HWI1_9DIPT|nr:CLUMA_CG004568, isoform A [Clunio marinus]